MSVCGIRCEAYYVYIASTLLQGTQIIQSLRKANTAKYRWCRKTVCHGFCKSHVAPHTESFFAPTSVLNGGWAISACFIPQSWEESHLTIGLPVSIQRLYLCSLGYFSTSVLAKIASVRDWTPTHARDLIYIAIQSHATRTRLECLCFFSCF